MKKWKWLFGILFWGLCAFGVAQFVQVDDYGVTLGQYGKGTQFDFVELYAVDFAGDTSVAVRTQARSDALVLSSWKDFVGTDPGSVETVIASNTMTMTAASASTGTLCVAIICLPENSPTPTWTDDPITGATLDAPFRRRGE